MTGQRVVFPEPDRVELEDFELGPLQPGQVRVRTEFSLLSPGTESIVLHHRFDEDSDWASYARFPFVPGYAAVGVVDAVADDVRDLEVGARVAVRAPHASEHHLDAIGCTPVPDGLDPATSCWFALAKIALMGARAADYRLGDTVAVIGAGPIGQMSVRWAVAAGARAVVVADPLPLRAGLARRGGATATVAQTLPAAADEIVGACGGRPRVVVDSTGNAAVFGAALRLAADFGRVVLIGNTGHPGDQRLTSDVLTRGLTVVGAHDMHSMMGPSWDGDRALHELFFGLVASGRFDVEALNTHVFTPARCRDAYAVIDQHPDETMGVVFDWRA